MAEATLVLGLTGSIGMGKSTVARQIRSQGVAVCDSDAVVHALLSEGGAAVADVAKLFPATEKDGAIDRAALGDIVFHDREKMQALEAILHPLVAEAEIAFVAVQQAAGKKAVVLEIPLLYEIGAESRCDKVIVVSAPAFIQRRRVLARSGMTEEKFHNILKLQVPDREKRRRADFVVQTGFGFAYSLWQVKKILKACHAA